MDQNKSTMSQHPKTHFQIKAERAAHQEMLERFPGEWFVTCSFPTKTSYNVAHRLLQEYRIEVQKILQLQLSMTGYLVHGENSTHAHLLALGRSSKGRTLLSCTLDELVQAENLWNTVLNKTKHWKKSFSFQDLPAKLIRLLTKLKIDPRADFNKARRFLSGDPDNHMNDYVFVKIDEIFQLCTVEPVYNLPRLIEYITSPRNLNLTRSDAWEPISFNPKLAQKAARDAELAASSGEHMEPPT